MTILVAAAFCSGDAPVAQEQARHEIVLNAKRYAFSQPRIEVAANDVVKITLVAEDIPHTFTIDDPHLEARGAGTRDLRIRADKGLVPLLQRP
jgi:hypothetical protein